MNVVKGTEEKEQIALPEKTTPSLFPLLSLLRAGGQPSGSITDGMRVLASTSSLPPGWQINGETLFETVNEEREREGEGKEEET